MKPEFSFRLNGTIVPMVFINRERVKGKLTGRRHIAVWINGFGRFTIDDDSNLWELTNPKHVLEYRNETEWENADSSIRAASQTEGWQSVTPDELVEVLICAGIINPG
jgi:hypothetical protein